MVAIARPVKAAQIRLACFAEGGGRLMGGGNPKSEIRNPKDVFQNAAVGGWSANIPACERKFLKK
jgi:hypothetical protein